MSTTISANERILRSALLDHPSNHRRRYDDAADDSLRQLLFRSLATGSRDYWSLFFPGGFLKDPAKPWSLRAAQGASEGSEYSAAAKGTACGHIFKSGESSYTCRTCGADETCVLCARCFDASDHEGHNILVHVSSGNSGCCDCGDPEAWRREVHCSIHTAEAQDRQKSGKSNGKDKQKISDADSQLPEDLHEAMRMTISTCIDYVCDVLSCAPEQTRLPKTEESVRSDEQTARLSESAYGREDSLESQVEWALVLWNDEKHTVEEVRDQVARACQKTRSFGLQCANQVNDVGRSILTYSKNLKELLDMATILEQIKVTVTIRSSRDTYREQMCATIIDWIADIAGCSVGHEPQLLRVIVCEELLKPWKSGSQASNKLVGGAGIFDHHNEEYRKEYQRNEWMRRAMAGTIQPTIQRAGNIVRVQMEITDTGIAQDDMEADDDDFENMNQDQDDDAFDDDEEGDSFGIPMDLDDQVDVTSFRTGITSADMDLDNLDESGSLETSIAGFAVPPQAPTIQAQVEPDVRRRTPTLDFGENTEPSQYIRRPKAPFGNIPLTPNNKSAVRSRPSKHWLERPAGYMEAKTAEPYEDIWKRVRLDYLILYDLRMWKTLRIDLRHLYITTIVTIPRFKAALGLRFASLYTSLAQLYLIADREPDHSIINLSLQILTTPTITADVVERGNFLTNLMAILFTFLTTRQVGFPEDINSQATLVFGNGPEPGAVTNRRMFHFLVDLKYMFQSELIHRKMRCEPPYLLQFLDLVKLHQGICPNVRATGEHVEYESDAWLGASIILTHINKLCKQVAQSFELGRFGDDGFAELQRAIRTVAQVICINAFGYERRRFKVSEIKSDLTFHSIGPFTVPARTYSVPNHVVQTEPASFHHPLHYILSWLIENAKAFGREEMRALLCFSADDLKDPWNSTRGAPWTVAQSANITSDELLSAIFDHPLRVCSWLAQIKAGMWVRNGITLRHQAHQYRNPSQRDVAYQRDVLMLQAGFVLCGSNDEMVGERFLAQMIDRFQMVDWFNSDYKIVPGFEEAQQLDVVEDFLHLLVIVLSERKALLPFSADKMHSDKVLQHEIAHALCFKALSFSELDVRLTEKVSESDDFDRVLESMTTYRPPPGLSDTGTFELKNEYLELIDPFYAHYSRNQREEAENIYKKHVAQKTGKRAEDVVFEPQLERIESGLFTTLPVFTKSPLFVKTVEATLEFAVNAKELMPNTQTTRIETFLHMVLHLILLAVIETIEGRGPGFTEQAIRSTGKGPSVTASLSKLLNNEEYASCHATIMHILRRMQQQPFGSNVLTAMGATFTDIEVASNTAVSSEDKERKKAEAKARQAKVLAQMKQQQNNFLQNQGLSPFGDDDNDLEDDMSIIDKSEVMEARKTWEFPSGNCILCQEETNEHRLYGTFEYIGDNNVLRHTPVDDEDYIREILDMPDSLDRSAEGIRPFGVAGNNKNEVVKVASDGSLTKRVRQDLSKGFPHENIIEGPVATSCGHLMHFACFQVYIQATARRHQQQIARSHPERPEHQEFVCPLCKALGNTFLPIIWKTKDCSNEQEIHAARDFCDWLADLQPIDGETFTYANVEGGENLPRLDQAHKAAHDRAYEYIDKVFTSTEMQQLQTLSVESGESYSKLPSRVSSTIGALLNFGSNSQSPTPHAEGASQLGKAKDLWDAYERLERTIDTNLSARSLSTLTRTLGVSITAFEVANRGVCGNAAATSMVSDIPESVLTHLRILSETIDSYLAINMLRPSLNPVVRETIQMQEAMTMQLLGSEVNGFACDETPDGYEGSALVMEDMFLFFADWLSVFSPSIAEATSILCLCYWAEIIKVLHNYMDVSQRLDSSSSLLASSRSALAGNYSEHFKNTVSTIQGASRWSEQASFTNAQLTFLRVIIDKYAATFLRRSILLMHIRYGLDYECPYDVNAGSPELQRLTALLHIPSIDELCDLYTKQTPGGNKLRGITRSWILELDGLIDAGYDMRLLHPAIFELVGLPRNYDTLTEEASRRKCPTTGKDLTDPVVCLICGEIFCSQAECCRKERKGGIYQHMVTHSEKAGIFIHIRKCNVLFAHGPGTGSFHQAPYLDRHGEADPSLRRRQQLFLNQKRYDKLLRETWLGHLVPTVVARKLEGDINPGGWESL